MCVFDFTIKTIEDNEYLKKFNNLTPIYYFRDLKARIIWLIHPLRYSFINPLKKPLYRECVRFPRAKKISKSGKSENNEIKGREKLEKLYLVRKLLGNNDYW